MPALKTCIECGAVSAGNRCPTHSRARSIATQRGKRAVRPYTSAEQARRRGAVEEWVGQWGYVCPGYQIDPHPSGDLTADHPIDVQHGGAEGQPLLVLCRSCNSRKAHHPYPAG